MKKASPSGAPPSLPPLFLERMRALLGDEFAAFQDSYAQPPVTGLRANTLKLSPGRLQEISPFALAPVPWSPAGFVVSGEAQPGRHPYHAAGLYYLQDPSAMAAAELLDPRPGELVLDLAAAPGGKCTHLAALMSNQGLLVSNEIHPQRAWELAQNLERWGARRAAVLQETPDRLAERWPGRFDRVLLDAPCSGEGMFRKSDVARREWTPSLPGRCAVRQGVILESAARLVRPGGRLAYSTCTFDPLENEAVIERFLRAHPEFHLLENQSLPGFEPGRPDWVEAGRPELARTVRLWPHKLVGEGHFVALLERDAGAELKAPHPRREGQPPRDAPSREAAQLFETFRRENLSAGEPGPLEGLRLAQIGAYLYALPPDGLDLGGLKALHPGWWLGELKKDRFQPSHALALALRLPDAARSIDLDPESAGVAAYLRGESFPQSGPDGWLLVGVSGFPLGWGRRAQGVVKNHYPRGLRWSS